jgi:hypothetical protein
MEYSSEKKLFLHFISVYMSTRCEERGETVRGSLRLSLSIELFRHMGWSLSHGRVFGSPKTAVQNLLIFKLNNYSTRHITSISIKKDLNT